MTTRRLFTAILFLLLLAISTREISDPDFWWHLRTGQFIAETWSIPHSDIFSHTNSGKPWVAHEWLSELFIFAVFRLGSFPLLILVFGTIITLAFALTYLRSAGQPVVAGFAVLLAAFATAPTWGVRPQIISMLLASVFLWILDGALNQSLNGNVNSGGSPAPLNEINLRRGALSKEMASRPLYILVPLMLLWVNLHSGFMLGIVLVGVYLGGELIIRFVSSLSSHTSGESQQKWLQDPLLRTLLLVFVGCLAVVPLNPNGITMYVYPFETLTNRAMQTFIQEWFSPDFHAVEFQPFALLLIATLSSFAISRRRPSLTELLLLVGSGYAGLRSARNIPIFALVAAPILARNLWDWLQARGWDQAIQFQTGLTRGTRLLNSVLLLLIGLAAFARVALVAANQSQVEHDKFPAAAVDFLRMNGVKSELYNSYAWGGYLIWRMYPTRVYIDGRADVYGDTFVEEFLSVYRGAGDWSKTLQRYNVGTILIEPDAPLAAQLANDASWRMMYSDKHALVFEK